MSRKIAFSLVAFSLAVGCLPKPEEVAFYCDDYPGFCNESKVTSALRQPGDCEDLGNILKENAVETMRVQLFASMQEAVRNAAVERAACPLMPLMFPLIFAVPAGSDDDYVDYADSSSQKSTSTATGAKNYSTTNTQEEGVDEADFVKNDASFIYLLTGNALNIYDAWPPESARLVSSFMLEGTPQRLYVHNNRALIYSHDSGRQTTEGCDELRGIPCVGSGQVLITVLDITSKEHPFLERKVWYNGTYGGSRRIGDAVHTTLVFPGEGLNGVQLSPESSSPCTESDDAIREKYYQLFLRNREELRKRDYTLTLPEGSFEKRNADGTYSVQELKSECSSVYAPAMAGGMNVVAVLSMNLTQTDGISFTPILGQPGMVYASSHNLYVAANYVYQDYGPWFDGAFNIAEVSAFHKFGMQTGPAHTEYKASGWAVGRVLNQFSMGEHNDYLQVATTSGESPSPTCTNSVFVLEQKDGRLEVAGSLEGIAPGEDIRSARFEGDRGFVVTFKKTDPLFTVDLSDPRNPRLAGQLEIPGFSTYIHMMDDTHLLTIGFDAQDMGDFAWFQGIQLQIFDVGDMSRPRLKHKKLIGTRGSSSEAAANHLAFNYFAPSNLLALPMSLCDGSTGGGNYGDTMSFSGLMLWDVTVENGFAERARISHGNSGASSCSVWWTDATSHVKRSIIMEDYVYSISPTIMKVNNINDPSRDVAAFDLNGLPLQ